jgi:predicted permease
MDLLLHELRHALRRLAHRKGLTAAIVLILGLGIGITTAVFSIVQRVLLRPIPVPELQRLVVAWETDPAERGALIEVSYPYFADWREQSRSFEDLAAFSSVNWGYEFKSPRESVPMAAVSASFFDTLRARPLLGRTFLPHDDSLEAPRVLILSHALWQRRFGGDPSVVGTTVTGGDGSYTIVGVMPAAFDFPQGAQVWTPVFPEIDKWRRANSMPPEAFRGLGVLYVVGRLKEGVTLEAARTDLGGISHRLSLADRFSNTGWDARLTPLVDHYLGAATRQALQALGVASVFVLLLACANVAVLLLVQAIARRSDLAVRTALGAGALRIAVQQVMDGALLALAGGMAGVLLARWAVQAVVAFGPAEMPGLREVTTDARTLGVALVSTLAAAIAVSLAPMWLARRLSLVSLLKAGPGGGGGGRDRRGWQLSRLLVTSEVALSIVLVVGSGLLVRSLRNLLQVELGFVPAHALSFSVSLDEERYPGKDRQTAFHRTLRERLIALPGVSAAGAVHNRPLGLGVIGSDHFVITEGQPLDLASVTANSVSVNWAPATPGYFAAVGTRLLAGRDFDARDTPDAPKVVVVSESLARRCWPGENPVGKRLHTGGAKSELVDGHFVNVEWQTVVGVVENARYRGLQNPRHDVFLSYEQSPTHVHYVVRTSGDPLALAGAVREQVRSLDPTAIVDDLTSMSRLVERALVPWRFSSALLTAFSLAALLLTASGLFAVLHHFVAGRSREIAIRMTLGAEPRQVRTFVTGQGLRVVAMGLVLGLGLALALARSLSAMLYGVERHDPLSYLGAAVLIGLLTAAACLLPARRAARLEPVVILRSE